MENLIDKIKWLRKNAYVTLDNMPPGPDRVVVITVRISQNSDQGEIFLQDDVDAAIECAKKYPKINQNPNTSSS